MMKGIPAHTLYHRWLGWHASDLRRALAVFTIGLIIAIILLQFTTLAVALIAGWGGAVLTFLLITWPIIIRAGSSRTGQLATREDPTWASATILLIGASAARSPISDAVRPDVPQHAGVELCGVAVEHVVGCPCDGQPISIRHQLCQAVGHRLDVRR
jgi:hypothetical protein